MEGGGDILAVEGVGKALPCLGGSGSLRNDGLLLLTDHGKQKRLSILLFAVVVASGNKIGGIGFNFGSDDGVPDVGCIQMC